MPYQDGAGWLQRLIPHADTFLIAVEAVIVLYCLYLLLQPRSRRLEGEEKILLVFVAVTLLPAVGALIGIASWFATQSIAVGVGAVMSFILSLMAFVLRE